MVPEGPAVVLPFLHDLRRYSLRDQVYRPANSASAEGAEPFQTVEGLSVGVAVSVRYALDPVGGETGLVAARALGAGGRRLVYGTLSGQPIPLDPRLLMVGQKRRQMRRDRRIWGIRQAELLEPGLVTVWSSVPLDIR